MDIDFSKQKIALITGSSHGIGLATAQMLVARGWRVYAASRSGQGAEVPNLVPLRLDVTNQEAVQKAVDEIVRECGHLDAVVCSAGNGLAGAVEDTDTEEARYQFETCFFGLDNTVRACLPHMRKLGAGHIVTLSSVAAIVPIPYQTYYSATKAAVLQYTKALSAEIAPFGIHCTAVLPGDTHTNFTQARHFTQASQSNASAYTAQTQRSVAKMAHDEQNGMRPERIAQAIVAQLCRKKPALVVVPRLDYKIFALLTRLLPNRVLLWAVQMLYG